jgi:probable F420-dependent oxidoreductase
MVAPLRREREEHVTAMRFTYAEAMTHARYYLPLAQAAEAAGYDTMTVADSLCYPRESDATYPYTDDGGREFLEDKEFIETFTLIAAMGAVTERIRFTPFVLKLPVRPPVLVAKQASSIAVLTDNRVGLGVGLSPWPEDFQVMGVPWKARGKRMDEAIDIVRGLTSGEYFEYHGEVFDVPEIKMTPAPTKPIQILVGGHSDAALRRAVRRGDGWMHAGGDGAELDLLLDKLQKLRAEEGKEDEPFEIHAISYDAYTVDGVKRLEDKGITDVIVGFRVPYVKGPDTEPLGKKIEHLERFAESVIQKVNP